MKTKIPESLTADLPPTPWSKILSVTPVVMTVVATLLAGLASSEMTRAQYDRAYAAQLQSKAGDQWNYFQAKKLRGAMQQNSLELLRAIAPGPATASAGDADASQAIRAAIEAGRQRPALDPAIEAAMKAVEASQPEADVAALLRSVSDRKLAEALAAARDRIRAFDEGLQAATEKSEAASAGEQSADRTRALVVRQMELNALRYDAEARMNQSVANLYELQVRKANISAERHHRRSTRFFFGMLAAQAAVIIATLAIAARARSVLWSIAAVAGAAAVAFAAYVYLYV
jgi:hypothetical protein